VKRSFPVISIGSFLLIFLVIFSSCKKINEATELGADVIPVVDNVTTFDTTLNVQAFNDVFTDLTDSTRLGPVEEHFLGRITNDPLFGKSYGAVYLQLKPDATSFPYTFENRSDSLHIDSVVLVLGYVETYGDSTVQQRLRVYEINPSSDFRADTAYLVRSNTLSYTTPLSPVTTFIPQTLDDSVSLFKEKAKNQLRIKLDNSFGQRILSYDTATGSAFHNDSTFNTKFKGFAIIPDSTIGNALIGLSLTDTNTKLAIYYRYDKGGVLNKDTVVRYFRFSGTSSDANLVIRNYNGGQIAGYFGGATEDNLVFLQNTPGTFATIKIPGLSTLTNRVVHRAELILEEVYDPSDLLFTPPSYLFLDAYDPSVSKYRTIPYDLGFDLSGNLNAGSFGMIGKQTVDASGNPISVWKFNLSRYVQHVVTKTEPAYDLRLSAPHVVKDMYKASSTALDVLQQFNVTPVIAKGRVRVGGGNHPTQKMRLHIIYSKI
jgi:hypothetical protein